MAEYVVVDKEQLEADLTIVADAIREKGGTSEPLEFPQGMKQAVEGIEIGGGDPYEVANAIINGTIEEFITYEVGGQALFYNQGVSYWSRLKKYVAPNVDGELSLRSSVNLTWVDTGITSVGTRWFLGCPLKVFILRSTALVPLANTNAFASSGISNGTGYIYVPRELVEDYKVATNWSIYANQFRALEDYTVDGTVTGALDESKI